MPGIPKMPGIPTMPGMPSIQVSVPSKYLIIKLRQSADQCKI
jgi:hypothetical protein